MTSLRSLRVIPALTAALGLGVVPGAAAHTEVRSTSPASGTTVTSSIARVSVTFSSPLRSGTLRVLGPGGSVASTGRGARDPRATSRLLVGLKRGLKPGSYTARWSIVAPDGHRLRGSFRFRIRA
jgi:methionine-rich copper-binding protein CopC